MNYYSTNNPDVNVSLREAVIKGLADDNGLFMPGYLKQLPGIFFESMHNFSFQEIANEVANAFFGEDIEKTELQSIINDALNFPIPLKKVHGDIYVLELFHGPTLAFKDVGARFMARMLKYLIKAGKQDITVLVATSGDTGSAVANGFIGVEGINVVVLYPQGLVSEIQEKQFTTLGKNIVALEVNGTFDDCQKLVKQAFLDKELNKKRYLTSANSINLARLLPQSFYYFYAIAQLKAMGISEAPVISVPSGNFGNLTAGLFAKQMGLPVKKFIAATNDNNIVPKYLYTGIYSPKPSVATISNAMDVGNPSNFARMLDLYQHSREKMVNDVVGYWYKEKEVQQAMRDVFREFNYTLDPHGAVSYCALSDYLQVNPGIGIFFETAHPAKFKDCVEGIIPGNIEIPERLLKFMEGKKQSIQMPNSFDEFKSFLMG